MKLRLRNSALVAVGVSLLFAASMTSPVPPAGARPATGDLLSLNSSAATSGPVGVTPAQIRSKYGYNKAVADGNGKAVTGTGQTIAIIVPGRDAYAKYELGDFITHFRLTAMKGLGTATCNPAGYEQEPCFRQVTSGGATGQPSKVEYEEIALDIEWAHVAAPGANITLVQEPASPTVHDADAAIQVAAKLAPIVSMSWYKSGMTAADASSWDELDAAFISGEGDLGYPETTYPAADPNVLSVGGTDIVTHPGQEWAWTDTGGGITTNARPGYQLNWTSTTNREVNDVSYNAVRYPIEMSAPRFPLEWYTVAGVSAGIPQWAGIIARADQVRATEDKPGLAGEGVMAGLYLAAGQNEGSGKINPAYFHDITRGCAYGAAARPKAPCVKRARAGYDPLTGLGSPKVGGLVSYLGYDL